MFTHSRDAAVLLGGGDRARERDALDTAAFEHSVCAMAFILRHANHLPSGRSAAEPREVSHLGTAASTPVWSIHVVAVVGRRGRRAHAGRGRLAPSSDGVACFTHLYLSVTQGVAAAARRVRLSGPALPRAASTSSSRTSSSAALDACTERSGHAAARLGAARRRPRGTRHRAAAVRAGRDERAHQPRPAGRSCHHLPRARHRARGGLGPARRLRARERRARHRRAGGEVAVSERLVADARPPASIASTGSTTSSRCGTSPARAMRPG